MVDNVRRISSKAYAVKASDEGVVEAYVSVFGNKDSYNEVVQYGAFAESIKQKLPKVVWQHDITRPIGITLEATEVEAGSKELPAEIKEFGGLRVKGKLNLNTDDGRNAYEHIKFGSIDEYSFGYEVLESKNQDDGTVALTKVRMHEWSPVTIGANPATLTASVKSYNDKCDTLDQLLADVVGHTKNKHEMRKKEGRTLSSANRERIRSIADALKIAGNELMELHKATEPKPKQRLITATTRLQLSELNTMDIN